MGFKSILRYAKLNELYEDVSLAEIADEHRRKTGEEPVMVVDGETCVRFLYRNCGTYCGGQYKQFREACRNFVQRVRKCGVRLVFFFHGLPYAGKTEEVMEVSEDGMEKINHMLEQQDESNAWAEAQLPEGLVTCARVMLKVEASTEVRLSMGDCHQEAALYAASSKNCLGIMSSNADLLVYKGVPSLFTFGRQRQTDDVVRMLRSSNIASHLGIQQTDLPAFATFLGNDTISSDELRRIHGRIGRLYGRRPHLADVVAELVKGNTVEEMCRIAFGDRWREYIKGVKASIDHYEYKPTASERTSVKSKWSKVLQSITVKHSLGEIPVVVLSVAKCHTYEIGAALEDLRYDKCDGKSAGEALQAMRRRMYTVLLWESGEGPFYVKEQAAGRSGRYWTQVEVRKSLPPSLKHPGLLPLWSGGEEARWRLFSWMVGVTDPEGSALKALQPQCLAVPAAALYVLRHEACVIESHEAEVFAVVAATVGGLTAQQVSSKQPPTPDPRAVFLAMLFVRTTLHVLDAAAVCGLSFPREADCQLDAYFDGKFFHELYLRAKAQSFARVGAQAPWDPSYLSPIHQLLEVIEGSHIDTY